MATTYFGLCDSAGNPTGAAAANTGSAETDWNNATTYTCPGSGTQVIQEISADLKNVTNYNIRLAVYNTAGTTLIAQGTAAVAVTGATDSWQGHLVPTSITPNPANLTGGTNYLIVVSSSGDMQTNHATNGGGTDGSFASVDETGGYPASLPGSSASSILFPVRVGVSPPASSSGLSIGSSAFHPGRSPGLGGISSARFQPSNWWPYSPPPLVTFDPAFMIAMEKHGNDPIVLPPQVVVSGMTPPEEMPT